MELLTPAPLNSKGMSTDALFPKHWGLQNTTDLAGMGSFPTMPQFPGAITEHDRLPNYDSPFGSESLFVEKEHTVTDGEKWKYKIETSTNGSELIAQYLKYDEAIALAKGIKDPDIDFVLYVEQRSKVNFNTIVLIKMSQAMIDYIRRWYPNNPTRFYRQLAQQISSQQAFNTRIQLTESDIIGAFELEMAYKAKKITEISGLEDYTTSELVAKIFAVLTTQISRLKIPDSVWKKESDIGVNPIKIVFTPVFTLVKVASYVLKKILPEDVFKGVMIIFDTLVQVINTIEIILKEADKLMGNRHAFAFLCGVINGLLALIIGIIEIALLVIEFGLQTLIVSVPETKITLLKLIEALENFVEAFVNDPLFMHTMIIAASMRYVNKRYLDSDDYEVAYYAGEDLVLIADVVITIVTLVRLIPNAGKKMPKFIRWIEERIQRNPKILQAVEEVPERKLLAEVEEGKVKLDEFPDGRKRKPNDQTRQSNYGEIKARLFMEEKTFKIGNNTGTLKCISLEKVTNLDQPIKKGIDAVYEFSTPPPKYIIAEVKMNTKGHLWWKPKLDRKITSSGGSQMQDVWILFNLRQEFGYLRSREIRKLGYERILLGVSRNNPMIIQTLDKNAKIIKSNIQVI